MASLGNTISRLAALRGSMANLPGMAPNSGGDRLTDPGDFGANPGALRARIYLPDSLTPAPSLVVVLHGCTQTAADYDRGSGWSGLADEHGFALLFPEQQRANNANLCFNWFQPDDNRRGKGELQSIIGMIDMVIARHGITADRVFVTGLSAGGAMTMALLASYPERFAGGGVIAGLPYGIAGSIPEAFDRMRGQGLPDAKALGSLVRAAAPAPPRWPRLSVWQGKADTTVDAANAAAIIAQWCNVTGLSLAPAKTETIAGAQHRLWRDAAGAPALEAFAIAGMGHGTPIATARSAASEAAGEAGPFMLDVGLSSTRRLAAFWEIAPLSATASAPKATPSKTGASNVAKPERNSIAAIIENALRQAGLRG